MQMVTYLVPHVEDISVSIYEKKYDFEWAQENMERIIEVFGSCENEQQI